MGGNGIRPRRTHKCVICGKEHFYRPSLLAKGLNQTCSVECSAKKLSLNRKGKKPYEMTDEIRANMSKAQKGLKKSSKGKKVANRSGEKHWNWKGGISTPNRIARHSLEFKQWREKVFARDNYTCQMCDTKGVYLHPHHIKSFSKFIELRYELTNGITLCKDCHGVIHNKTYHI